MKMKTEFLIILIVTAAFINLTSRIYRLLEAHNRLRTTFLVGFSLEGFLRPRRWRGLRDPACPPGGMFPLPLCPWEPRYRFAFMEKLPFPLTFVESACKLLIEIEGSTSRFKWWDTYPLFPTMQTSALAQTQETSNRFIQRQKMEGVKGFMVMQFVIFQNLGIFG